MYYHDIVHCSYDLGTSFYHRNLQTRELSQTCGCYWISPAGELFEIDYTGTQEFIDSIKIPFRPNGQHGKVTPVDITTTIKLQPAKWDCYYAKCPTCWVTLHHGKIANFTVS